MIEGIQSFLAVHRLAIVRGITLVRNLVMKDAVHTVDIPFHLRFMQIVRPIEDWKEWLELGEEAKTMDQKIGLLHVAFDVPLRKPYTPEDRLKVFFEIADGWGNDWLLKTRNDQYACEPKYVVGRDKNGNHITRTESEQREVLARKAFGMLAAHFFRMPSIREDNCDRSGQESELLQKFVFGPLFSVVQNFFRVQKDAREGAKVRNLSYPWRGSKRSQQEEYVVSFLLKLARFLWRWKEPRVSFYFFEDSPGTQARKKEEERKGSAMRAIVDNAKPWMVEVLSQLEELRLLENWILDLNEACLAALREIAMRNELRHHVNPVPKDRRVVTIDEACYLGSTAGWLLKKHELAVREHKRLSEILAL